LGLRRAPRPILLHRGASTCLSWETCHAACSAPKGQGRISRGLCFARGSDRAGWRRDDCRDRGVVEVHLASSRNRQRGFLKLEGCEDSADLCSTTQGRLTQMPPALEVCAKTLNLISFGFDFAACLAALRSCRVQLPSEVHRFLTLFFSSRSCNILAVSKTVRHTQRGAASLQTCLRFLSIEQALRARKLFFRSSSLVAQRPTPRRLVVDAGRR